MKLRATCQRSHPESSASRGSKADPSSRDGGFILVTLGLLIIPIIAFTALAVDVSSWYSRATELQRAADASSLAGVVWMPELGVAQTNATASLATNAVVSGSKGLTATVQPGSVTNSLRVCVTDTSVPQYFASLFSNPESITRCATALYNVPLQLGSPLNYFGGNTTLTAYQPGTQPANAIPTVPAVSAFGSGANRRYCRVRSSYPSGAYTGYWDRTSSSSTDQTVWRYYLGSISGSPMNDCGTLPPAVPDSDSFNGTTNCNVIVGSTRSGYWYKSGSTWYFRAWNSGNSSYATCGYGGGAQSPIPSQKSPGMWAAVLGPNNTRANGDVKSTTDGQYRPTGYWYSVDIPATGVTSGGLSIQAFDAATNCDLGCRTTMGDDSGPGVRYRVYYAGSTPYDLSDDTLLCDSGDISNGGSATYNDRWWQMCNIGSPAAGGRYYINVRSISGSGYNGYALRAVAGTYPAACMLRMPVGNVACYGAAGSVQPALSAYGDMEMYNGILAGTPTQFFLANVKPQYAGKTLRVKLWDPGDGAGDISVQILKPGPASGSPEAGVTVPQCTWIKTDVNGTVQSTPGSGGSSGTLSGVDGCKLFTTVGSTMRFQDRFVTFQMNIPTTYTCNPNVDPTTNSGSCWWQIKYTTTQSTSDYTTWSADIVGDPVRLVE